MVNTWPLGNNMARGNAGKRLFRILIALLWPSKLQDCAVLWLLFLPSNHHNGSNYVCVLESAPALAESTNTLESQVDVREQLLRVRTSEDANEARFVRSAISFPREETAASFIICLLQFSTWKNFQVLAGCFRSAFSCSQDEGLTERLDGLWTKCPLSKSKSSASDPVVWAD